MSNRENRFIEKLNRDFTDLLDRIMESDAIDFEDKDPILKEMKFMIDNKIRELHNKDFE